MRGEKSGGKEKRKEGRGDQRKRGGRKREWIGEEERR
jgi:hypothetical protein